MFTCYNTSRWYIAMGVPGIMVLLGSSDAEFQKGYRWALKCNAIVCPNIFLPFPELGTKCPQHINSAFFVFILYVNYLCICHTTLNLKTNFEKEKKHFFRDIQSFCKGCNGFIWQSFRLLNICVIWFWLTSCCNRWLMFYIIFIVPSLAAPPFDIYDLWSIFLGKYFPFSGGILVANVSFLTTNLAAERRCDNT